VVEEGRVRTINGNRGVDVGEGDGKLFCVVGRGRGGWVMKVKGGRGAGWIGMGLKVTKGRGRRMNEHKGKKNRDERKRGGGRVGEGAWGSS